MGRSTSPMGSMRPSASRCLSRVLVLGIVLLSVVTCVGAYDLEASTEAYNSPLFQELANMGQIHIDRQQPPVVPRMAIVARNSISNSTSTTATSSITSTRSASSSGSTTPTVVATRTSNSTSSASSVSSSSSTTSGTPTALPTPFDTSLGINFTSQACPTFFNTFINNATFKSCLPVSLLLQNSIGFFKASRSSTGLDTVLDASCAASLAICSPLMASIADQLIDDSNCGVDYRRQNPIVNQAYTGLLAYEPLYTATCIENTATGNYCFVDAVNSTNAADMYPYYTALGLALPQKAFPTCSNCLQQTMKVFAGYASQKDQPLSTTYNACASQVNGKCGADFSNADVKVTTGSSKSAASQTRTHILSLSMTMAVLSWLILV